MKIRITHDSPSLRAAGFEIDQDYDVSQRIGETMIGSRFAVEVVGLKAEPLAPENKSMTAPENK
jgi:hypothetical protein